jgi:hypothetical protein
VSTIATSLIQYFFLKLTTSTLSCSINMFNANQIYGLQPVLNSAARAVTRTPKCHHITPVLKSLQLLTINQSIQYKVLCFTQISKNWSSILSALLLLFTPHRSTRSSSFITLNHHSGLKMSRNIVLSLCSRLME